jgi:hypothetical protein
LPVTGATFAPHLDRLKIARQARRKYVTSTSQALEKRVLPGEPVTHASRVRRKADCDPRDFPRGVVFCPREQLRPHVFTTRVIRHERNERSTKRCVVLLCVDEIIAQDRDSLVM